MKGKVSGRVARVERQENVSVLTLIGEVNGEACITQVRFPGRSAAQVADVREGDAVLCEAELRYRQWRTANGEPRAETAAVGLTCYVVEGGDVVSVGGYLALRGAMNSFDLLAYVVKSEARVVTGGCAHARIRVWVKDARGERHYYSVDFRGAQADAVRSAASGMILHLNVTAHKVPRGTAGWTDQVRANRAALCRSRVHAQATATDPGDQAATAPDSVHAPLPGAPRPGAPRPGTPVPNAQVPGAPRPAPRVGAPRPGAPRPGGVKPALTIMDDDDLPDWFGQLPDSMEVIGEAAD